MKRKFNVGDRVKCVDNNGWGKDLVGKYGIVTRVVENYYGVKDNRYSVEFEDFTDGHSCEGTAKQGHGWNCEECMLELVTKETIVIYRKGDEVIALDKVSGKTGVAKCGRNDKFDFATGARIAFDRLFKESEKTPLNVKIVFTKGDETFKTGHIYEIKNGRIKSPATGNLYPNSPEYYLMALYSLDELKDYFTARKDRKLLSTGWSYYNTLEFIVIEED